MKSSLFKPVALASFCLSVSLAHADVFSPADGGVGAANRRFHTTTLLPTTGRVLSVGGIEINYFRKEAQLYDPATNSWKYTAPLSVPRAWHTATVLPNGKVLVAGGETATNIYLATAELYDPATATWSPAAPMSTQRTLHTATLLPNGKVLVVGGHSDTAILDTAELYDPATNAWTSAGTLSVARWRGHTATFLPLTGKVLVVGGSIPSPSGGLNGALATAELYDPITNTWSLAAPLPLPRRDHSAAALPNGKLLVIGGATNPDANGYAGALGATTVLYDPAADTWSAGASAATGHFEDPAILLPDGRVFVTGPSTDAHCELYDPFADTWSLGAAASSNRNDQTATLLPGGRVLIDGGATYAPSFTYLAPEIYTPVSEPTPTPTPTPTPEPPVVIPRPHVGLISDKRIVTTESRVKIRCLTYDNEDVDTVVARFGGKTLTHTRKGYWTFTVRNLRPGRNKVTITATGAGGTSKPVTITIIRK